MDNYEEFKKPADFIKAIDEGAEAGMGDVSNSEDNPYKGKNKWLEKTWDYEFNRYRTKKIKREKMKEGMRARAKARRKDGRYFVKGK